MALKSEQARALRRRVIGGVIRNLVIFTGVFALACSLAETFLVPSVADYVVDQTAPWRTLNSTSQYEELLQDTYLSTTLFEDFAVSTATETGYAEEPGTIEDVRDVVNLIDEEIGLYASDPAVRKKLDAAIESWGTNGEDLDPALSKYLALDDPDIAAAVADETPINETDEGTSVSNSGDEQPEETNGSSDTQQGSSVPFVGYQAILASENVDEAEASATQAFAALRIAARIQELYLKAPTGPPLAPEGLAADEATRILCTAALYGMDQEGLDSELAVAYRDSQTMAYEAWGQLDAVDQARQLGISNDHPSWQIEQDGNGTFRIRDIATYQLLRSFKLPLAALALMVGWLVIIFRSLNRSLRYFDELSGAVATLLADKDAPVDLPADLAIARNELTVIRRQSLADERAAHAAEQRKNELVAYLAHDIRTPLTSVLGYLDLLRETTDLPRDTLRKYADVAYAKAERLESLINEFFEITRYNLSAIPIERETIGVRLFCQQVAEAFFPEASARNIRISVDVGPSDQFFVDPDKLARALGNVLRNAVAYADPNSVIALTARQDARVTTITVSNRGREISEAHLESIFEKFYREDGARTTRSGGAGLGLAIAKEIVVAHHGDIEAASRRGVTVFTLRIPTHGEDDLGLAPVAPAASTPRLEVPRTGEAALPPKGADASPRPASSRAASSRTTSHRPVAGPSNRLGARRSNAANPADRQRAASAPRPVEQAERPSERSTARRQSTAPLNPRNGRHSAVPPRGAVRDNGPRPRRRGLPH